MGTLLKVEPGVVYNELIGGNYRTLVTKNVKLASDTADFKRGMVMVDGGSGEFKQASSTDTTKTLYVLANDVSIKGSGGVATVYIDGVFNREALKFKDGTAPSTLDEKIAGVLTSIKGGKA